MGERKVLNKYYPPDFDPAELPKRKRPKTNEMKVRMMLPMTVQCRTCGHFMYKGTKFNTKKEDVVGQDYLGIQIYRFYYRCRNCAAEFTMKTDPKTSDYLLEEGASRNYEPWREQAKEKVMTKQEREEEEMGNAMKALENRTLESKREMDIMAALDEMRSLKSRQSKVTTEQALEALQREANKQVEGGLAAEEAADLQEFYALRSQQQQQQRQSNTKLLPDTSSSGEEEDMSTHFRPRGAGAEPSSAYAGGSDVGARTTDQNSSKGASRHGPGGSGAGTASGKHVRKGAVGGAGRSLAALAMMEDGEEEEQLAEQEQQQQQQQQQQKQQQQDGNAWKASEPGPMHGAQQQQGQGVSGAADGQQQQQQQQQQQHEDGSASGRDGQHGSSQRGGDLLSDALASVQGKDKAAQQQQGPSKAPLKPQIRVMAKPKAPAQQQQQHPAQPQKESSPEGGMGGLGLLGSYGSSSSEENNS